MTGQLFQTCIHYWNTFMSHITFLCADKAKLNEHFWGGGGGRRIIVHFGKWVGPDILGVACSRFEQGMK